MVMTSGTPGRTRGRIRIGSADPSLTGSGGMLAVTELCGKLGLIEALDAGIGPLKQRRFTARHWRGAETGLAQATARMAGLLPQERAAELSGGPVTIDIDATDVEVYGSKKRGVAYTYAGQRAVRDGAAAAGRKIALRADAGYFAGDLARAAAGHGMAFAIGAKRITTMWRALAGIAEDAWRDAIDMKDAQVAVSPYKPADWPGDTVLLIRRVKLDPDQVSADPRSRRRRTLHPDQRDLLFPELAAEPAIYAYSFILTNIDVSTPARAVACEYWYRHRTSIENIFRDSKHGAALRHLPSGYEQVNTAWMRASLIAAAIAAWLHQLTGLISGGELLEGHGVRGGKAMIATLRRALIATPARLVSHGGQLILRLAPGAVLLPAILATIRALPAPG